MFQIDLKCRKAIYEQIIDNFKKLITNGILKENEKVPSTREMALILTVNPNTIQKAYRELEKQGYFYTVLGQGSFISKPKENLNDKEINTIYNNLKQLIQELIYFGESNENIKKFIENECLNK